MDKHIAESIARRAHHGQFRKLGKRDPFIVHPIRVRDKVATLPGMTQVDLDAAVLHDVFEDCGGRKKWEPIFLEAGLSPEVVELVAELTFPHDMPGWSKMSYDEKNEIRFAHCRKMSHRARRIKLVDRWDNLRDLNEAPKHFIERKYKPQTLKILEIIGDADEQMKKEVLDALEKL